GLRQTLNSALQTVNFSLHCGNLSSGIDLLLAQRKNPLQLHRLIEILLDKVAIVDHWLKGHPTQPDHTATRKGRGISDNTTNSSLSCAVRTEEIVELGETG